MLQPTHRRSFLTLLGTLAAAWPLARGRSRASGCEVGVLLPATADDAVYQAWLGAFGLALLGWTIGRNVLIDKRCVCS